MELVVGGRFQVGKRIGGGSFGEIYLGIDMENDSEVALKLEPARTRSPQLEFEARVYKILRDGVGIPKMIWFGRESNYNILIMEKLGLSLEDLFQSNKQKMSLKSVLMIIEQTLNLVQFLHQRNIIHRDIKPDNFVMGTGTNENQVYIIDYGLSKRYRNPKTHQHIKEVMHKSMTGTARYASVSAMKGFEQSRRDDLESLGYVWMYLLRGSLPWQGLPAKTQEEKMNRIIEVKETTPFETLCEGFPSEFVTYFQIVRKLEFTEEPNYTELKNLFRNVFIKQGFIMDYCYDWTTNIFKRPLRPIAKEPMALPPPPMPMTQPPTAHASPRESDDLKPVAQLPGKQAHHVVPRIFEMKPVHQPGQRIASKLRNSDWLKHQVSSTPFMKTGPVTKPINHRSALPTPKAKKRHVQPTVQGHFAKVVLPKFPAPK